MDGGIYTREKCSICGKVMRYTGKGCLCPDHPLQRARTFIVKFPPNIYKTFTDLNAAEQELNHLRHEKAERGASFNPDDYRSLRPNSFAALAPKYLERKKSLRSYGKVKYFITTASDHFGKINVRDISGGMIEDYLYGLKCGNKTRANHCSQLHDFWTWVLSRGDVITLAEFPAFPVIKYELKYRKIISWEVQENVLQKVKEQTYHINPKVHLACDLLAHYTALRPDDLRRIRECDFDGEWIHLVNPTKLKNKAKHIRLHPDHCAEWDKIRKLFPAMPDMPFFRHHGKVRGTVRRGIVFGPRHLSDCWNRACEALGVEGVPLYPGTKHTTASETAKLLGSERAKAASGLTNKAFNRYCQVENSDAYEVVTEIRRKKGEIVPLRKAE